MQEKLGNEIVLLVRMHYLVAEHFDFTQYGDFVRDASNHEDIRDLYLVSDLLITDYSSVFFDYANLQRPMLFIRMIWRNIVIRYVAFTLILKKCSWSACGNE